MTKCPICQHPKREAIDADLARRVLTHRVTFKYRITKEDLAMHQAHLQGAMQGMADVSQQNCMTPVPLACAEAISVGSQRLANCERFLVAIMDRLEQVLGNETGLHEMDMHDAEKQFQQAWQQMKEEPTRQQRMIAWLNEQLQRDDMGLP